MGTGEPLFEQLNKLRGGVPPSRSIILGIGNLLRGDDGAGSLVCQHLQRFKIGAEIIDAGTVPENYIQPIVKKAPANLLIIDAMDFGASAGTIRVFKPEQLSSYALSTHTLSPHLFVDIIKRQVKADVYFIGIQPAQTHLGQAVSGQVDQAIQQLSRVLAEIFPPQE
jgi:hydrogenase 3 maturation protease